MGGCASKDKKDAVIGDATTTTAEADAVAATTNGDATDGCVFYSNLNLSEIHREFVSWRK